MSSIEADCNSIGSGVILKFAWLFDWYWLISGGDSSKLSFLLDDSPKVVFSIFLSYSKSKSSKI